MWKCKNKKNAENILSELMAEGKHWLCIGRSIYDNHWYIGTRDQLDKIGCVEINS